MKLLKRIARSLRSRTFYGYCDTLRRIKSRPVKLSEWQPVDESLPRLVAIVYDRDVPLLIKSLQSLALHHSTLPPLTLFGDSDRALALLKECLPASPGAVVICHWEEALATLQPAEQTFIRKWLASGKFGGYAKKFAITLAASRRENILLSDADIIWFSPLLDANKGEAFFDSQIVIGLDYTRSYDSDVASFLGESKIMTEPPINCGFVFYPQGVIDRVLNSRNYEALTAWAAHATCHFEQTLIAYVFWKTGGRFFAVNEVATSISDDFCYRNKIRAAVRHYAGCKHLFWRDI